MKKTYLEIKKQGIETIINLENFREAQIAVKDNSTVLEKKAVIIDTINETYAIDLLKKLIDKKELESLFIIGFDMGERTILYVDDETELNIFEQEEFNPKSQSVNDIVC